MYVKHVRDSAASHSWYLFSVVIRNKLLIHAGPLRTLDVVDGPLHGTGGWVSLSNYYLLLYEFA
jgi:hypothetical protein